MGEEEVEAAYAVIGNYRSARLAHDAGLAVLACGHPYWVKEVEGYYLLVVSGRYASKLKLEVDETASRNRFWPPNRLDLSAPSVSKGPTVAFAVFLGGVFWLQNLRPEIVDRGINSSVGVIELGEWWRIVTAITLHADIGHLAGNLLGLSIFAYLSCRYLGNGLAWMLILLAASLSNLSNAALRQGEAYASLGASTAVFAALGLLAGYPIGRWLRTKSKIQSSDWLIPFFGGCVAFAWMGGGEFPTDVPGHFWAFGYGLVLALLAARFDLRQRFKASAQWLALLACAGALGLCWSLALRGL